MQGHCDVCKILSVINVDVVQRVYHDHIYREANKIGFAEVCDHI